MLMVLRPAAFMAAAACMYLGPLAPRASAQEARPAHASGPAPISTWLPTPNPPHAALTVSGGVSLGSYQAGATWAFIFVLQHYEDFAKALKVTRPELADAILPPTPYQLDVVTGASAGNINGMLAAIHYCDEKRLNDPDSSLFYKVWIPIGFNELTREPITNHNRGVFSRTAFDSIWHTVSTQMHSQHYVPGCRVTLGIALTKLTPEEFELTKGVDVPLQRFAAVFRVATLDRALEFTLPRPADVQTVTQTDVLVPAVDSNGKSVAETIDPNPENGYVSLPITSVRAVIEASGAFPVAFAPRQVSYETLSSLGWQRDHPRPTVLCREAASATLACLPPETALFVDGGIFDNRPLNLALDLSLSADKAAHAQLAPAAGPPAPWLPVTRSRPAAVARQADSAVRRVDSLVEARHSLLVVATGAAGTREDSSSGTASQLAQVNAQLDTAFMAVRSLSNGPLPRRLVYFIRHETMRGRDSVAALPDPEPPAGIAAGLQVLSSSYETAQNAEMRLFVNRVEDSTITDGRFALGVNSRYPLLMGEQISHFGAFIARTFREYDYYAGVYDGLRSAFRELYCRPVSDGESLVLPAPPGRCEQQWLRIALDQGIVRPGPGGLALIEHLFALESGRVPAASDTSRRAGAAALLLTTLADANLYARGRNDETCETQALLVDNALCSEQLLSVLNDWADRVERAGIRDSLCKRSTPADQPTSPAFDPDACAMAFHPYEVYHEMALRAMVRLELVENDLDRRKDPSHMMLVSVPVYVERAFNEQFRGCWQPHILPCTDINPTTSDVLGGWWLNGVAHAIPSVVGKTWSGTATWMEWRPTWYIGRWRSYSFAAASPMDFVWSLQKRYPAAGASLVVMPPGAPITSLSLSHYWPISARDRPAMNDITVGLFAGVLRVGFRDGVSGGRTMISRGNFTIGLGDANGLSVRALRHLFLLISGH